MNRWTLIASLGFALSTSACASKLRTLPAAPQLTMPTEATRPCELSRLPANPTLADLELGYARRGVQILACDGARRLAVQTHADEHALEAKARR
jgi:hypothetical protein